MTLLSSIVENAITGTSPTDLAAAIGGLSLVSENLHHLPRLEALATLVVAGAATGTRSVDAERLRELCNGPLDEWMGAQDDPWEYPFTETFTFHGGSYLFVPGGTNILFILRALASACVGSERLEQSFQDRCTRKIQAIAVLSNTILNRARLPRNANVAEESSCIVVPDESRFEQLKQSVTFGEAEFIRLLASAKATWEDVDNLVATPGDLPVLESPYPSRILTFKPLLAVNGQIIVLAPYLLAQSVVRWLCIEAIQCGNQQPLAEGFHRCVTSAVESAFEHIGMHPVLRNRNDLAYSTQSIIRHHFWQIDSDKLIHLAIVTDALGCGELDFAIRGWPGHEIMHAVELGRARAEKAFFGASESPPNEILTLVACEAIGRDFWLSPPRQKLGCPAALFFSAADLETIAIAEGIDRDPLLFWKFAFGLEQLSRNVEVRCWSPLDLYGIWRARGRRFLVDEDLDVDYIGILPGTGAQPLRWEAIRNYDWHSIPDYVNERVVEVGLAEDPEVPIYTPRDIRRHPERVVEINASVAVWVTRANRIDKLSPIMADLYFNYIRTVSYWIWQFARWQPREFEFLGTGDDTPVVEVDLGNEDAWQEPATGGSINGPGFSLTQTAWRILITITPTFLLRYTDFDNVAERELASQTVEVLLVLFGRSAAEASLYVQRAIEHVAPRGRKRMMHSINALRTPEMAGERMFGGARHVQPFDHANVQQRALMYMRDMYGSGTTGNTITGEKCKNVLNTVVGRLYADLQREVAQFKPEILPYLMTANEALLAEDAHRELTLASVLACYATEENKIRQLSAEVPRHALASIATRFLIEYVAACPSRGLRPVSDAAFDELLAIASEIVYLGTASDVSHLGLADVALTIRNRDYAIQNGTYTEAIEHVKLAFLSEKVRSARADDAPHDDEPQSKPPEVADLDNAARQEFGHSLTDMISFIDSAVMVAEERRRSLVRIPKADFVAIVSARLGFSRSIVSEQLAFFSLQARQDYLRPQRPFEAADALPWKFNRALSYLRRPFVCVETVPEEDLVYFTPGMVRRAAENLLGLCLEGRLKNPKSPAMRKIMSRFTDEESRAFNAEVANTLREQGFEVRERVAKIGSLRLQRDGDALGDIDVLAIDRARGRLWLLECKDFRMARAPHEIAEDLKILFLESDDRRSMQQKHERRVEWVRDHIQQTVAWLGISITQNWQILGGLVFSAALVSPLLGHARIPVWTVHDIRAGKAPPREQLP